MLQILCPVHSCEHLHARHHGRKYKQTFRQCLRRGFRPVSWKFLPFKSYQHTISPPDCVTLQNPLDQTVLQTTEQNNAIQPLSINQDSSSNSHAHTTSASTCLPIPRLTWHRLAALSQHAHHHTAWISLTPSKKYIPLLLYTSALYSTLEWDYRSHS